MISLSTAKELLTRHGQEHLLAFHDQLDAAGQKELLGQIERLDLPALTALIRSHVLSVPAMEIPTELSPAPTLPATPKDEATVKLYERARAAGERLIAEGKVAALTVAGGDGTRLGYAGPKGCLAVTPVKRKPLFEVFAEQILATARRFGGTVPWYVMTSPKNDAATRAFFQEHHYWGVGSEDVFFFTQGEMPAIGLDGRIVLAEKGRIALNPDGHGGTLTALRRSGALEDMARRGVEFISYFQVDNPLVRAVDPLFIGLHAEKGSEMSAKALPKREPLEKLGNFCLVDGKATVIEYSDLPEKLALATRKDGTLMFNSGSIAIHILSRRFVESLTAGGACRLPPHRAVKAVPCVGPTGEPLRPDKPNAVKLEMFIFDALPMAKNPVILETQRDQEFSPVKNATGADSLATCLHDQVRRAAGWLEAAGVKVPRDADGQIVAAIEISPMLAMDQRDLLARGADVGAIRVGEEVYLD